MLLLRLLKLGPELPQMVGRVRERVKLLCCATGFICHLSISFVYIVTKGSDSFHLEWLCSNCFVIIRRWFAFGSTQSCYSSHSWWSRRFPWHFSGAIAR